MKLETKRSEVTEGNLSQTGMVAMQVSEDAMEHIMDLFTRLYEDARLAIIREYTTNAIDAHVEAGIDRAIDVTLPTVFNPFLRIRDYGVGLTVDDIREIYSQYGASTKRNTNAMVGALGMGCKSGLAYTEQFTITSRKDGKTISVIVSRSAKGGGSMNVVDERPMAADEEGGTEITIPIRREDIEQIANKARDFFKYWPEGSVLIDGEQPARLDGMWLTPELCIVKNNRYSEHRNYVVMGNVPYPIDTGQHSFETGLERGMSLVAFVPIGAVSFTPSREALRYEDTDPTKAALDKVIADFAKAAAEHGVKSVKAARTKADALKAMIDVQQTLPRKYLPDSYTYRGKKLPSMFKLPARQRLDDQGQPEKDTTGASIMDDQWVLTAKVKDYVMSRVYGEAAIPAEAWPKTIWIVGFPEGKDKLSADQKRKMDAWAMETFKLDSNIPYRDWPVQRYALLEESQPSHKNWLDPKTVVEWETINARKLPLRTNRYGVARIPGSYDLFEHGKGLRKGVDANEVMANKGKVPLYWMEGNEYYAVCHRRALDAIGDPYQFVLLPANRVEKFKRTYTHAELVNDAIRAKYDAWIKTVTDDQRAALALHDAGREHDYALIAGMAVDDPELVECGRLATLNIERLLQKREQFASALAIAKISGTTFKDPLKTDYPVWDQSVRYDTLRKGSSLYDHLKLYLNAAYAARVKGDN